MIDMGVLPSAWRRESAYDRALLLSVYGWRRAMEGIDVAEAKKRQAKEAAKERQRAVRR